MTAPPGSSNRPPYLFPEDSPTSTDTDGRNRVYLWSADRCQWYGEEAHQLIRGEWWWPIGPNHPSCPTESPLKLIRKPDSSIDPVRPSIHELVRTIVELDRQLVELEGRAKGIVVGRKNLCLELTDRGLGRPALDALIADAKGSA